MKNITYAEWLEQHLEELVWVIKMAHKGIRRTPNAGNDPAHVLLPLLECDVEEAWEKHILIDDTMPE